ncbi:metallophosphatase [Mobilicoccus caccae]|uniref:Metallophosphatase n=2 Tax=Mobilicoccus caccae TaxID=1859295 RepID=A0ABQ6IWA2_9MICO|nr:metallophosphatase [Mobilicoccus caccae]
MLRHVDSSTAAVWVQTDDACEVEVRVDGIDRTWSAPTFAVHGYHYALVEVEGLESGRTYPYSVTVDGRHAWPEDDDVRPPGTIRTFGESPLTFAFGSCRESVPHDAKHNASHGVDALRTLGLSLAEGDPEDIPDVLFLLGDQVYADITSDEMREFIASRRSLDDGPGEELRDYVEYEHLYRLAWSEPHLRWVFATLPSSMIFDDHDIRDDWNTSAAWRKEMAGTPWWQERIVAGLGSYWVYQHLGNLSIDERAEDPLWRELVARRERDGGTEVDLTDVVDDFAARVNEEPDCYRFSYSREVKGSRVIVVDSRAARVVEDGERAMLDDAETAWLDEQMRGEFEHVFVGTSLPFLLTPGLHHVEAFNEALAEGAYGPLLVKPAEWLRQTVDLEHWAAFNRSFERVAAMATDVADGNRGEPPRTVTFLSGDVHNSYVSEVVRQGGSQVLQLVCSPIRNPLPRFIRWMTATLGLALAEPMTRLLVAFPGCRSRRSSGAGPTGRGSTTRSRWSRSTVTTCGCGGSTARSAATTRTTRDCVSRPTSR